MWTTWNRHFTTGRDSGNESRPHLLGEMKKPRIGEGKQFSKCVVDGRAGIKIELSWLQVQCFFRCITWLCRFPTVQYHMRLCSHTCTSADATDNIASLISECCWKDSCVFNYATYMRVCVFYFIFIKSKNGILYKMYTPFELRLLFSILQSWYLRVLETELMDHPFVVSD